MDNYLNIHESSGLPFRIEKKTNFCKYLYYYPFLHLLILKYCTSMIFYHLAIKNTRKKSKNSHEKVKICPVMILSVFQFTFALLSIPIKISVVEFFSEYVIPFFSSIVSCCLP